MTETIGLAVDLSFYKDSILPKPTVKTPYVLRCFVDDYEAMRWLNDMAEQGYVIHTLVTDIVQNGRDRRKQDVQMTILVRLDVPGNVPPANAKSSVCRLTGDLTLRDLHIEDQPPAAA